MIDLHCHILPGLDDGAKTMEEAVAMARVAESDGITAVVGTPHLFRDASNVSDLGLVSRKKDELKKELRKQKVSLDVYRGVEIRFSHNLLEEVKKDRAGLVIHDSSYMFIEFPFDHVFSGVKDIFFNIMTEGITPIITHPERNSSFIGRPELLYELLQMGALAQANSGSFLGQYGSPVREAAFRFLRLQYYQFISSDAHSPNTRAPRLSGARQAAAQVCGEEEAQALVLDNPRAVLEDQALPYLPDPLVAGAEKKSLKIKIPSFFRRKT